MKKTPPATITEETSWHQIGIRNDQLDVRNAVP
jgi:hypothetical protein